MQGNGAPPQDIKYPVTNVQVAPDGILISIIFSPTIKTDVLLDSTTCNQIVKLWVEQKKQQGNMLDVARRIQNERLA